MTGIHSKSNSQYHFKVKRAKVEVTRSHDAETENVPLLPHEGKLPSQTVQVTIVYRW